MKFVVAIEIEIPETAHAPHEHAREAAEYLTRSATAGEIEWNSMRVTKLNDEQEVVIWRRQ